MLSCLEAFTATNCKNAAIRFAVSCVCLPVTTHEPLNRLPQYLILWNLYWNLIAQSAFGENFKYKWTVCRPICIRWDLPPVTTHESLNRFPQNLIFLSLYWNSSAQSAFDENFNYNVSGQCVDPHALNDIYKLTRTFMLHHPITWQLLDWFLSLFKREHQKLAFTFLKSKG
jgi:hypothetical protein